MQYIFQDTIYSREFHTTSSFVTLSKAISSIEHIEMNKKRKETKSISWTMDKWILNNELAKQNWFDIPIQVDQHTFSPYV